MRKCHRISPLGVHFMLSPPVYFFVSLLKRLDLRLHYLSSCPAFPNSARRSRYARLALTVEHDLRQFVLLANAVNGSGSRLHSQPIPHQELDR